MNHLTSNYYNLRENMLNMLDDGLPSHFFKYEMHMSKAVL